MYYSAAQLAKEIGITGQTVRNWVKWKWITPAYINPLGEPQFSEEQAEQFKAAMPVPSGSKSKEWLSQFPRPETVVAEPASLEIIPRAGAFAIQPDPDSKVANLLKNSTVMMLESFSHEACDLTSPSEVVRYTTEYFNFCAELGMMPSKRRLANWMGYSYRALETQLRNNTRSGKYIDQIFDIIKDNLEQSALFNKVNNISAMFILKSQYGYVEANKVILEPGQSALGTPKSIEEIEEAIENDIVED